MAILRARKVARTASTWREYSKLFSAVLMMMLVEAEADSLREDETAKYKTA